MDQKSDIIIGTKRPQASLRLLPIDKLIQLKTPKFEIPFPKLPAPKPAMDFGEKMLSALELEAK